MCGEYFQEGHGSGPPSPSGCQNFQGPGASFCFHQVHYESEANATHTDTDTHLNGDKRQPAGHLLPRVPMLRGRRRGHDALTQSGIWKAELISDDQRSNESFLRAHCFRIVKATFWVPMSIFKMETRSLNKLDRIKLPMSKNHHQDQESQWEGGLIRIKKNK